jgi:hypothetical protein
MIIFDRMIIKYFPDVFDLRPTHSRPVPHGVDVTSEIVGWFPEEVGDGGNMQLDVPLIGARLARRWSWQCGRS